MLFSLHMENANTRCVLVMIIVVDLPQGENELCCIPVHTMNASCCTRNGTCCRLCRKIVRKFLRTCFTAYFVYPVQNYVETTWSNNITSVSKNVYDYQAHTQNTFVVVWCGVKKGETMVVLTFSSVLSPTVCDNENLVSWVKMYWENDNGKEKEEGRGKRTKRERTRMCTTTTTTTPHVI